jgi:hypothetical protein
MVGTVVLWSALFAGCSLYFSNPRPCGRAHDLRPNLAVLLGAGGAVALSGIEGDLHGHSTNTGVIPFWSAAQRCARPAQRCARPASFSSAKM